MQTSQYWQLTNCYDKRAARLLDRHYSRAILNPSSVGKNQIAIANAIVLVDADYTRLWITTWQNPIARNDGKNHWVNSAFRNESNIQGSLLIADAVAISLWAWRTMPTLTCYGDSIPVDGFTTYIASKLVTSEVAGYSYMRSKPRWKRTGKTISLDLDILHLSTQQLKRVESMIPMAYNEQERMF